MLRGSLISFGIAVVRFLAAKYKFFELVSSQIFQVCEWGTGKTFKKFVNRLFSACHFIKVVLTVVPVK